LVRVGVGEGEGVGLGVGVGVTRGWVVGAEVVAGGVLTVGLGAGVETGVAELTGEGAGGGIDAVAAPDVVGVVVAALVRVAEAEGGTVVFKAEGCALGIVDASGGSVEGVPDLGRKLQPRTAATRITRRPAIRIVLPEKRRRLIARSSSRDEYNAIYDARADMSTPRALLDRTGRALPDVLYGSVGSSA
jgi:hypothetical protein